MRSLSASLLGLLYTFSAIAADLPEGAGKDVVVSACTTCHTADRIVALKLTEAGWRIAVRQMIEEGASFNPGDIEPIIAYLVKNLGAHDTQPVSRVSTAASSAAPLSGPVSFNRDIRPIMSRTCFSCHGPDVSSRMADMRLDLRDEALKPKARGTPIVPGDPDQSEIIQRIFATDARVMPPASANRTLTPTEKETLRRWIAEGARY
jgi:mono/diheme cytochrome c family protein